MIFLVIASTPTFFPFQVIISPVFFVNSAQTFLHFHQDVTPWMVYFSLHFSTEICTRLSSTAIDLKLEHKVQNGFNGLFQTYIS